MEKLKNALKGRRNKVPSRDKGKGRAQDISSSSAAAGSSSSPHSLWDEAYDSLKVDSENGKLILKYEKILETKFPAAVSAAGGKREKDDEHASQGMDEVVTNDDKEAGAIASDPVTRDAQMKAIVSESVSRAENLKAAIEDGQKRTKLASKLTGYYGTAFDYVELYKPVIDAGLKNVPHAALPWAIVSSALGVSSPCVWYTPKADALVTLDPRTSS
jgi:N-terminal domain of NWD NACHT-NTPase